VAAAAGVAATIGATGALAEVDRIVGDFTGVVASERGGKALRQGGAGSGIERRAGTPGARTRTGADVGGVDEILGAAGGGGSGGRGSAGTAAGLGGGSGGAGRPQVRIAAPAAVAGSAASGAGRQPGALMAVVQRHSAAVRFCYNRLLQKRPGATGQIVLRLTVAGDGSVTSAVVARTTFNDAELESCVMGQAREWRFAPAEEASFTFDVPFVFTPPAEG
jgi:TonB family protein